MTAVLAAMEPGVVWEVDLLPIPEVVVSRVVIFLEEVRVVPMEGFRQFPGCSWWWADGDGGVCVVAGGASGGE